jgi:hypothetical protein
MEDSHFSFPAAILFRCQLIVFFGMCHHSAPNEFEILIRLRIKENNGAKFVYMIIALLFEKHTVHQCPPSWRGITTEDGNVGHGRFKVGDHLVGAPRLKVTEV